MNGRLARALLVLVLPLGILAHSAAADSEFVIQDPLRFTFPLPKTPVDSIAFYLFSKEGTISDVRVRVRDVKDPNGQSRPPETLSLQPLTEVTPSGAPVVLKLAPQHFVHPGEYQVTLLIEGKGPNDKPVTPKLASVVINHPAAEINLDDVKDQTVTLRRNGPLGTASRTISLYLTETSGKSDITELEVSGQQIYV